MTTVASRAVGSRKGVAVWCPPTIRTRCAFFGVKVRFVFPKGPVVMVAQDAPRFVSCCPGSLFHQLVVLTRWLTLLHRIVCMSLTNLFVL